MKYLHMAMWFVVGFLGHFAWDKGEELRQEKAGNAVLIVQLASCRKSNTEWETLVKKWGADQSTCDAVLDFNKAMDVLDRETKIEAKKKGVPQ